jgi:hypothetical protein
MVVEALAFVVEANLIPEVVPETSIRFWKVAVLIAVKLVVIAVVAASE